ncbi:type IV pilin protein [Teredinibacter waterburyi]|jgi:prepilin-type N-terminal cleavage/methylation domain|uniref:type IV pilin protein n=1 Tax=Teredinibacter waterburyi TaxID=1500538 RepID=UPI00165FEBE6|nr:type IV pilin protein [Teredinibacter waterburyi]
MKQTSSRRCKPDQGFTLVELMIVLAIIAVLTAFAWPNYRNGVLRSHRAEAMEALLDVAQNQEMLYSTTNAYSTNAKPFSPTAATLTTENGYYLISVANGACGTTACFKATATAQGGQAEDSNCLTMSIDSLGSKTSTPAGNDCWP